MIAAHRGGGLIWPENSLTAFRNAVTLGVDVLELDVHLTLDDEVVVIHDATLHRTTTGRGAVRAHTWTALAELSLKKARAETIPRLTDILDLVGHSTIGLFIEVKVATGQRRYPGIEQKIFRLVEHMRLTDRTTITAFQWDTLRRFRSLSGSLRLAGILSQRKAMTMGGIGRATEELVNVVKATDLGIERSLLWADAAGTARAAGLALGVWTVNEPNELRRALEFGVDWVITDRPDLALALRSEMG